MNSDFVDKRTGTVLLFKMSKVVRGCCLKSMQEQIKAIGSKAPLQTTISHWIGGNPERTISNKISFSIAKTKTKTFSAAKVHIMTIENVKTAFDDRHFVHLKLFI